MHAPRLAPGGFALLLGLAAACADVPDDSNIARGRGLPPATLAPAAEAGVYDAAVRASFDVSPDLVLMLHPRRLPRTAGYDGGDPVPDALVQALRDRGVVRGRCEPKHEAPRDTPRCAGSQAGYVIRASPVMQSGRDTLQLNFAAEAFAAETGARPPALRFEKIYQLVRQGSDWRVVREARVHE
ncbi:MAG TPA: hypothetical protein VFN38_01170 [Gemmatimonadaceae bacterium]|nr:hypothetical protein [Gemmatimonadaceae bacterium]